MFRAASVVLAILVVGILVGCEGQTDPATQSSPYDGSWTLNGQGRCTEVEAGQYWYEVSNRSGQVSSAFAPKTPGRAYNCSGPSAFTPLPESTRGYLADTPYAFRLCGDGANPDTPPVCVDSDGTAHPQSVQARSDLQFDTFRTPPAEEPPPPSLIPPNAVQTKALEFNSGPINTSQCPHPVPVQTEGTRTYAHFQRIPGEPQAAGGFRCEVQSSTYIGKGEYWFEWESRYPDGYEPNCASWCTMRQWHENTSDGGGPVYLAMFMQNGRPQIDGQFVGPGTQNLDVDVRQWHTYTARVNFNSGTAGFAELWIDGVFSGRTTTNRTATPSNSYDKEGTYGGDSNTLRTADYNYSRSWRIP